MVNLSSQPTTLRKLAILAAVFFIGLTFLLYWSCLRGELIWDDYFLVKENLLIRSPILGFEAFRHFLGYDPSSNFYRPVQTITYLLDYWRGGLVPLAYHQTNMVIHGLNATLFLTYLFLRLKNEKIALDARMIAACFLIVLFWMVHPIYSATVAYIAGRADSLALLFLLLAWCLWEKSKRASHSGRLWFVLATLIAGFLALCSKEAALAGMGFFLINALCLEKNLPQKHRLVVLSGCLVLLGTYLALRLTIVNVVDPNGFNTTPGQRPVLFLRAIGDYLRLLVWPAELRMERQVSLLPNLYVDPASFDPVYPWLAVLGVVFLAILLTSFFYPGTQKALRRFGVLWFGLTLLPVSNVFSLNATVAEHWLYIPAIGFFISMLGWWLEASKKIQNIAFAVIGVWIISLSCRTVVRSRDWAGPIIFFEKTIHDGGDTARMRVNLANEYRLAGRLTDGEAMLRVVLQKSPTYYQAKHALATNLQAQGRSAEAVQIIGNDENVYGDSFSGRIYSAHVLLKKGEIGPASRLLKTLGEEYPDSWMVTKETLYFFETIHQTEKKMPTVQSFAARNWWHKEAQMMLGDLYAKSGQVNEAIESYKNAARLDIRNPLPNQKIAELEKK